MRKNGKILFLIGMILLSMLYMPCLILGENAVFTYHDQLDGEMIAYILQAKHLGEGGILPEFLGGASKTALIPPAPGCVLLFRVCSPLTALFIMQLIGSLIGYAGMYLLAHRVTDSHIGALVSSFFYGILPFLPVYGLAQWGLPLLVWCAMEVQEKRRPEAGWRSRMAILYGAFYALNSSPVLVGFAVMSVMAVWVLRCVVRDGVKRPALLLLVMAIVYCGANLRLIAQLLGIGTSGVSHKAEYVLVPESFVGGLIEGFIHGGQHSVDYHVGILIMAMVVLASDQLYIWMRNFLRKTIKESEKTNRLKLQAEQTQKAENATGDRRICDTIIWCVGCNFIFALIAAIWNSAAGMEIRKHLGAVGAFQMDRFLWLAPCLWYLALGCCVGYVAKKAICLLRSGEGTGRQEDTAAKKGAATWIATVTLSVLCCATLISAGIQILKSSDIKSNVQKLRNQDYPVLSYSDYYAFHVMDQVREYLHAVTGMDQEEYRVVSLGIDPAAALYHGFYCLDGYSNNYSLEYKHAFRRVIAPALEESEYLRAYFDDWGNRCYLFGSECPGYYTIEKNGFYFQHLELDTEALRELGGDYLLSAAYIVNSEELGLELLTTEPFETEDSYYGIYLYRVAP